MLLNVMKLTGADSALNLTVIFDITRLGPAPSAASPWVLAGANVMISASLMAPAVTPGWYSINTVYELQKYTFDIKSKVERWQQYYPFYII